MNPKKNDLIRDMNTNELGVFISKNEAVFPVIFPIVGGWQKGQRRVGIDPKCAFYKSKSESLVHNYKSPSHPNTITVNLFHLVKPEEEIEIKNYRLLII